MYWPLCQSNLPGIWEIYTISLDNLKATINLKQYQITVASIDLDNLGMLKTCQGLTGEINIHIPNNNHSHHQQKKESKGVKKQN